jgi:chorismate mutase/prephenate dehydratase
MSLDSLRRKIDRIDDRIVDLLAERIGLALETAALKPAVRDAGREAAIVSRLQARASASIPGRLSPDFIAALYALIFAESRKAQESSLSKEVRP